MCFSSEGLQIHLPGTFLMLDAEANGNGCGYGGDGVAEVQCWGTHKELTPTGLTDVPQQISVSGTQVCVLASDGTVSCTLD